MSSDHLPAPRASHTFVFDPPTGPHRTATSRVRWIEDWGSRKPDLTPTGGTSAASDYGLFCGR